MSQRSAWLLVVGPLAPLLPLALLAMPALLATLALPAALRAQPSPQWGQMQAGPHGVGFMVVQTFDESRSYWPPGPHLRAAGS